MVLELAITSQSNFIVTFNSKDLAAARRFPISLVTPRAFLQHVGELP
jgi:predicted nucleic acid-binding protein